MGLFSKRPSKAQIEASERLLRAQIAKSDAVFKAYEDAKKKDEENRKRSQDEAKVQICNKTIRDFLTNPNRFSTPFDIDECIRVWSDGCDIPMDLEPLTVETIQRWKQSNERLRDLLSQPSTTISEFNELKMSLEKEAPTTLYRRLRLDDETSALYQALLQKE